MSSIVAAYIFSIASLFAGVGVCALVFGVRFVSKLAVGWFIVLTAAYFTNMLVLIVVVIAYVFSLKRQPEEVKLIYFVGLMPVLPLQSYIIPFPGLNYLWDLSFLRLLVLSLIAPLFFQAFSARLSKGGGVRSIDIYFFCYFILVGLITIRSGNVVSTMRSLFSVLVDFIIPYYVVSRCLKGPAALHWLLCALLITAAILTFASAIEVWRAWRFFSETFYSLGLEFSPSVLVPLYRDGVFRGAGGTMFISLSFAFFMSLACVISFYFLNKKLLRFFPATILFLVCLVGLLSTDSKGGILAFVVGIFTLFYFKLNPSFRFIANIALLIAVPPILIYLITTEFSTIDSDGSFAYRYQLFLNSLNVISQSPLFGSDNFTEHASLESSIQGQGIVDVVNMYLQVVLQYGFVGLFLYVMIFFSLIKDILKKPAVSVFDHRDILLALIITILVFALTSSDVSFVPYYITFVWAVGRAYLDFPERTEVITAKLNNVKAA